MKKPREPRAIEARYISHVRGIFRTIQGLVSYGLAPLLELWPEQTTDAVSPPPRTARSAYPSGEPRAPEYNPLAPRPRRPRIWNLSDNELQRLWPGVQPDEIREFAPWATSRAEVRRIMPTGEPDVEDYVRRAIVAERSVRPRAAPNHVEIVPPRRPPRAFRLRPRQYAPVVLGENGFPIPAPPTYRIVDDVAVRRSMEWVDMATSRALVVENLSPGIARTGQQLDLFNARDMRRVLGVDVRDIPGMQNRIDQWREINVGLIESGVMGPHTSPQLRAGLLGDVSETVEAAHRQGLRVEVLADDLRGRFGVSDSRAELIARDQVLKLNSQVSSARQQAAGVEQYRWSTSGDERVREGHAMLDGSVQSWSTPPHVGDGRYEHPGGDYQCRCVAIPIIPEDD